MEIIYPYNERLPKKTAHDVYVFRNCVSLQAIGLSVNLLCGWGSLKDAALHAHYQSTGHGLTIQRLPLMRKWGPFSCNALFFWASRRFIDSHSPNWVLTSVMKQAAHLVMHKRQGVCYGFEVHELGWYPTCDTAERRHRAAQERAILQRMDLVTTTTNALKQILRGEPYHLKVPIEVVPLAVDVIPLPPPPLHTPFTLFYIGQLYASQGVELLLRALTEVPALHLEICGGTPQEVQRLWQVGERLGISDRVVFHGFLSPSQLPTYAQRAHAFVAPFHAVERMPYVAHTKLLEYAGWGRPVIAPRLDVVQEHFNGPCEEFLFTAGDVRSLVDVLRKVDKIDFSPVVPVDSWIQRAKRYRELLENKR